MFKIIAFNLLATLLLASCSHSNHAEHHHSKKADKPCADGQTCDDSKKEACCDKQEKTKDCCKG